MAKKTENKIHIDSINYELIVCSALTNGVNNDNINTKTTVKTAHLKIARIGTLYGFFYSLNNTRMP